LAESIKLFFTKNYILVAKTVLIY